MDYLDIGFSNIRLLNDDSSYTYRYDSRINTFPEETYLHEFLHTLERVAREYGHECVFLHDYGKFGYDIEPQIGLKKWYGDFMTSNIGSQSPGIDKKVYTYKPVHEEDFKYSMEIEFDNNPDNIFEEIHQIFDVITKSIKRVTNTIKMKEGNTIESSRF